MSSTCLSCISCGTLSLTSSAWGRLLAVWYPEPASGGSQGDPDLQNAAEAISEEPSDNVRDSTDAQQQGMVASLPLEAAAGEGTAGGPQVCSFLDARDHSSMRAVRQITLWALHSCTVGISILHCRNFNCPSDTIICILRGPTHCQCQY